MKEKFLYNSKSHTLHIIGHCTHTTHYQHGHSWPSYMPFVTEHEALAYDGLAVRWCKLCLNKRNQKMEESTK